MEGKGGAHARTHTHTRAHAHAQPNVQTHITQNDHTSTRLVPPFFSSSKTNQPLRFLFFPFGVALFDFVSLSTCLGFHIVCLIFLNRLPIPSFSFHSKHLLPLRKRGVARRKAAHKKRCQLVMNGGEKKSLELLSQPDSATAEDTTRVYVRTCRSSICATRRLSCRFESTQKAPTWSSSFSSIHGVHRMHGNVICAPLLSSPLECTKFLV